MEHERTSPDYYEINKKRFLAERREPPEERIRVLEKHFDEARPALTRLVDQL